ncbi:hypothetical protein NMG60_11019467 [Bertholletia excelsa]
MVTSAWAKPGAWALDSEEHESELLQQQPPKPMAPEADYPSLMAAAAAKTKKKKKPQAMPLSEFTKQSQSQPTNSQGLTDVDRAMLPTGPRERTAEELDRSRLGGGFRSFDRNRYGDESSNSRWGSSRVSSDEPRRQNRELAPSRADGADDWGASKKAVSSERRERGRFFGSDPRADESESWVLNKSFVPSEGRRFENPRERRVGFESNGGADSDNWVKKKEEERGKFAANAGGFDSLRERRGGFDSNGGADSDTWLKKKEEERGKFAANGGAFDSLRERRGGFDSNSGADSDNWGKKREEGSGAGRPRLNLQPRTLSVEQNGPVTSVKPKGSNPFGAARPREEVLREKGQDWKEIEEKLETVKAKEVGSGTDTQSFWKGSHGNEKLSSREDRAEKSWRKAESEDVKRPIPSSDEVERGLAKEAEEVQE